MKGKGRSSKCPACGVESGRVHSRYERRLQDMPLGDYEVELRLEVRKYFCENRSCERRIYGERFPEVVKPNARRTVRLEEKLVEIGLALGGAAGERLSRKLGYGISDSSLLYLVSKQPLPERRQVKVVGVDDFAFRRGQRYGTILVDIEAGEVIELLKDREAETLAAWLKAHPGIEILTRDRSQIYRKGMNEGAGEAKQVVDRFHLLQNLEEVLEASLRGDSAALREVERARRVEVARELELEGGIEGGVFVVAEGAMPSVVTAQASVARRMERRKRYERVLRLKQRGRSVSAISRSVGVSQRTVSRWLKSESYPERQRRSDRGQSKVDEYKDYILERYDAGERSAKQLYGEIKTQGYEGSYMTVTRYVKEVAKAVGALPNLKGTGRRLKVVDLGVPKLTARRVACLVMQVSDQREAEAAKLLKRLKQGKSEAGVAIRLADQFIRLVRQRRPEALDQWLEEAEQSCIKPLAGFAQGIREDYEAIKAGVTVAFSNGPVEGQINRLKMIKRQMYGRAGLDLLRRRVILA
ncbi:MAG: ISL3 family transposase [Cyanobacteria bacterium J06635_15]